MMTRDIRQNHTITHDESGFTLIEIMIAIVIITFGLLGIALLQVNAMKGSADSIKLTEATMFAVNQAEQFMDLKFDSSDLEEGKHGPMDAANPLYQLTWEVRQVTGNTKDVTISVNWAGRGRKKELSFNYVKSTL